MKIRFLFFISFLLVNLTCFSQKKVVKTAKENNGYTISINTKNLNSEKILLYLLYGSNKQQAISDSITIKSNEQKVEFKNEKKVVGAIYYLKIASKTEEIKLAIDNNSKIDLTLESNLIETISCSNNLLNKEFIEFQKNEKKLSEVEVKNTKEKIATKYPASIINLYFKVDNKIYERNHLTTEDKTKYRDSFFNFIDKNDKRIYLLPNIYKLLYSFVTILPVNNDNYTKNIDLVLKNIPCDSKNYAIYTKWFVLNLNYFEAKNLDASFVYLYKTYIDKKNCDTFSDADKNKNNNKYASILKTPMNSIIPDFTMIDKDSISHTLSKIYPENDFTYVGFYSPNCTHCNETYPKVSSFFTTLKAKYPNKKIQLISVLNDTDEAKWQNFIESAKMNDWLNLKSTDKDRKFQTDFNAVSNPTFFLVNRKGQILLKSFNTQAIEEVITTN